MEEQEPSITKITYATHSDGQLVETTWQLPIELMYDGHKWFWDSSIEKWAYYNYEKQGWSLRDRNLKKTWKCGSPPVEQPKSTTDLTGPSSDPAPASSITAAPVSVETNSNKLGTVVACAHAEQSEREALREHSSTISAGEQDDPVRTSPDDGPNVLLNPTGAYDLSSSESPWQPSTAMDRPQHAQQYPTVRQLSSNLIISILAWDNITTGRWRNQGPVAKRARAAHRKMHKDTSRRCSNSKLLQQDRVKSNDNAPWKKPWRGYEIGISKEGKHGALFRNFILHNGKEAFTSAVSEQTSELNKRIGALDESVATSTRLADVFDELIVDCQTKVQELSASRETWIENTARTMDISASEIRAEMTALDAKFQQEHDFREARLSRLEYDLVTLKPEVMNVKDRIVPRLTSDAKLEGIRLLEQIFKGSRNSLISGLQNRVSALEEAAKCTEEAGSSSELRLGKVERRLLATRDTVKQQESAIAQQQATIESLEKENAAQQKTIDKIRHWIENGDE